MSIYNIEFITPLFSRGAYEDRPEVRSSSIRGQFHWWFRALGGNFTDERAIFGGIGKPAFASKVVIRVSDLHGNAGTVNTLPHKTGGQASPKTAFQIGTHFQLHVLARYGGLQERLQSALSRTLETWLMLGTLGLRSTRAAGSFRWKPAEPNEEGVIQSPADFATYEVRCLRLIDQAPLRFALLSESYSNPEEARKVVSDTLGGRDDKSGQTDLERLNHPLGKIFGGRKTSPLRFRIVGIGPEFRIAAVWDARANITGNKLSDLTGIINLLKKRKPALGEQLYHSKLLPSV